MMLLAQVEHRPWPIPTGRWIMLHIWEDLLFLHWPIAEELIRPLIPSPIAIDTFEGQAWIALVPFRISLLRLRGMPRVPPSSFVELNVRTYVTYAGKPGVWFLSLDASSHLAVCLARAWYRLPYFPSRMRTTRRGDVIDFTASRQAVRNGGPTAEFQCSYRPVGEAGASTASPLVRWLTERYCLYTCDRRGQLYTAEIHHVPWPLQAAVVTIGANEMFAPLGLPRPEGVPLAHFSRRLDAIVWPPRPVSIGS
jgi:hypothetical protein